MTYLCVNNYIAYSFSVTYRFYAVNFTNSQCLQRASNND